MFSPSLVKKELREQRWLLITGVLLMTVIGVASAATYYLLETFKPLVEAFLEGPLLEELRFIMSDYTTYLWSQWNPKNLLQIGTILAILAAAPAVAGEWNRGSLEFLLSRPLRRRTILFSKAISGIVVISITIWLSTLLMLLTAALTGPEPVAWGKLLGATALTNAGLLLVYCLALLCSVFFNDSIKAGATAAGILFVYSSLGLFTPTRMLSFFYHMRGWQWFTGQSPYPWLELVVLVAMAAAVFCLAAVIFEKREY